MKTLFKNYCKDKLADLGHITLHREGEEYTYRVVMTAEGIREYNDVRVIIGDDTEDYFVVIDSNDNIVINTPMIDPIGYASRLEFKQIDPTFYNEILTYWDDMDMDTYMEDWQEYTKKEVR